MSEGLAGGLSVKGKLSLLRPCVVVVDELLGGMAGLIADDVNAGVAVGLG